MNQVSTAPSLRFTRAEVRITAILLAVIAVGSFWLASNRTFDPNYAQPGSNAAWPSDFYRQQALSLLDGRLDVPFQEGAFTECFFRDSQCYGYFGVVPSLLRLVGFAATASTTTNPGPVIIATGVTTAVWAAIFLAVGVAKLSPTREQLTQRSRLWLIVLVGALLGPGGLLTFLSQSKLYYEAVVMMIAGLMVAFAGAHRWVATRRPGYLVIAIGGAACAANSRPTAIIAALVLGVGIVVLALRGPVADRRRDALLGGGIALLPAASAFGIVWLKLREFSPSWPTYTLYNSPKMQELLRENDGVLQGPRFIVNHLVNYLRPDSLARIDNWPWVQHAIDNQRPVITIPPITPESLYIELVASLPNTMPVALVLTIGFSAMAIVGIVRFTSAQRQAFVILILAAATVPFGALTMYALTTRYLGDFYPVLAVGTVFGLVWLLESAQPHQLRFRLITIGILASAMITTVINFGLQLQTFTNLIG